jgi:hypothetical protein
LTSLHGVTPIELALRLDASPDQSTYVVYVGPAARIPALATELLDELASWNAGATYLESGSAVHLLHQSPRVNGMLVVNAVDYAESDWRQLDLQRSAFARTAPIIFLTTSKGFEDLVRVAPNLSSWIGANAYEARPEETVAQGKEQERLARLASLRAASGMTDEVMVKAWEANTLSNDPRYAEWLVLIGRGDLLRG